MSIAETKASRLLLLAMVMAATAVLIDWTPARAFEICGRDGTNLILQCQNYVRKEGPKVEPSKACCGEVQKFDVACVCKSLPPSVGQIVSMEKLVYVARRCGKQVPSGTKCGGYVVPPEWRGGQA